MFVPTVGRPLPLTFLPGVPYGEADGTPLLLDLLCPRDTPVRPRPAAIWLHGGGWSAGSRTDGVSYWCALLAAHGFVAASVDFRPSGDAPFPAQLHDVKAAIRWLRANAQAHHIDPARIGLWGFSSGGHLAALASVTGDRPDLEGESGSPGHSSRVQAVAVGSAPTDFLDLDGWGQDATPVLTRLFGGPLPDREAARRLASPALQVAGADPPFLIAHGTLDETVPFAQAERLRAALAAAGGEVVFHPIDGGYHNWNARPESTFPAVRYWEFGPLALAFFARHLRP